MKPHTSQGTNAKKLQIGRFTLPCPDFRRTILALATIVIISSLMCIQLIPSRVSLKLGDIAPETIIARRSVRYRDSQDTELRRTQAEISVGRAYEPSVNATDQAMGALETVFHNVAEARDGLGGPDIQTKIKRLRQNFGSGLGTHISSSTLGLLLTANEIYLRTFEETARKLLIKSMSSDIKDDEMNSARVQVVQNSRDLKISPRMVLAICEVVQDSLRPNRIYSENKTEQLKQKARDAVQPVYRQILVGEIVIAKGETVLQQHIEKFEALGLLSAQIDFKMIASLTTFVMMVVFLFAAYLVKYHLDIFEDFKALLLLSSTVVVSIIALRMSGGLLGVPLLPSQVGHLGTLWIITSAMLISVLIDTQVAVVASTLLSVILAMTLNNELRYASGSLITALVGIYSVQNIRGRSDFLYAVVSIAITGVMLDWVLGGLSGDSVNQMMVNSFWAISTAAISGMLFWLGSFILERPLGRTTHISLLELADTDRPLLRRLVIEAPGTYTHSVTVGHLAETAAEAINADSLVARVASYYHDIGKMRRPHFFIENQHVENAHDRLNPTLSALVITSHVKDGIDFGKEFGLPPVVMDIIAQHHGTSLVQYFYHQATVQQDPSVVLEQQFRYSGPKPQTKEAAVVMLADAVEAASRSLEKPTPVTIELMVNRIVADKLRDGQLDESDLTFREVGIICACFSKSLVTMNHARIEYPDPSDPYARKADSNAGAGNEPSSESDKHEPLDEPGASTVAG